MNGAQVDNTAPAAFSHLQSRGTHSQMVVGFSLGSQTVMQYLLTHLAATGRPVESAIIVSGMAHPRYVKWPHWALPIACEILHHGPIVDYFWEYHWSQRIRGTKSSKSELLRQRQQFGSCTALTGARRLRRGVRGLKPGIFNGTRMLIVEHTADRWVTGCFPAWKHLCNQAEHLVINGPGHADFTEYIGEYTQGINSWLHATA
jgi:pimeloyl-ACP methyl ester carboxylesterase